ncbi:MAG TPA: UDP-N-acetylmuramoyl-L-alanine--D-glutamate ligase [Gammaproteobacteria bacterium]|nr:UDP-N-acetylmuramoyl-L-alanine--D-glutamate ligase [Gammaproteobacteria bacterium]
MAEYTPRARKRLVVGLGRTGLSCARYLARQGCQVAVTDSRVRPPELASLQEELPDVALFLGGFNPEAFEHAEQVVVSPGVPLREPLLAAARQRGVEVIGDIELFARAVRAPVVAVTGSNGKSTVTTLVGEMARCAGRDVRLGGNIGIPALALLNEQEPDLYVLELSSFQLESTFSLKAAAAVVLNISPDHLDRYASLAEYSRAKQRIYHGAAVQVVNADDTVAAGLAEPARPWVRFTLGEPEGADYGLRRRDDREWLVKADQWLMPAAGLRLVGRHNLANALAALALGEAVGLPLDACLDALRRFPGLPHRTEFVAEHDGVRWYNDSKGTNLGATLAAIEGMPGPVVLIAGGDGKGADFTPLREPLVRRGRAAVLIGRDAPAIETALAGVVPVVRAGTMDEAVERARELARSGDDVLLSPACASFDMFSNYEERGRVFADAVRRRLT